MFFAVLILFFYCSPFERISCANFSSLEVRRSPRGVSEPLSPIGLVSSSSSSAVGEQDDDAAQTLEQTLLCNDIKSFAMQQLNLSIKPREFHFSDYFIKNWPRYYGFRSHLWDEEAVKHLRTVLPTLIFTKKTAAQKRAELIYKNNPRIMDRRNILDDVVKIFVDQTGVETKRVLWTKYHLEGWPLNVGIRADRWAYPEILAIHRNLDKIKFIPIRNGQRRTVTFLNGQKFFVRGNKLIAIDEKLNRKRKVSEIKSQSSDDTGNEDGENVSPRSNVNFELNEEELELDLIEEDEQEQNFGEVIDEENVAQVEEENVAQVENADDQVILNCFSMGSELGLEEGFINEFLHDYNPDEDEFY